MRPLSLLAPLSLALLLIACGDSEPLLPPDAVLPDGGRYRGEVVDGLLQGPGRLDYSDGSYYQGPFKDGQFSGLGEWRSKHGELYTGEFQRGDFHGQGSLTYSDGSRYEGGFANGMPSGEGHLKSSQLEYRGEFSKGQYNGLGKLQWSNGASFQGQFKKGEPDGQGVLTDAEGNEYVGTFDNSQLNGQGSFKSLGGDLYSGQFRDNQFHGKGRYQSADGDVWSGRFAHGSLTGKGEFKGSDGSHYAGLFSDWSYHGEGRLSLADGSQQSGTWQNGRLIRDAQGNAIPDALATGLLEQGRLLDAAIAKLPASTPAIELYALTLAGDGKQSVFMREADYVGNLLQERFAAHGLITLVNHRDHLADRPLATSASLSRSVQALAERSGEEDLIFIYLTSHGSAQHELNLDQPRMQLDDLPASELAALLEPLKDRHKVLVISACYSGGFIPKLQDEKTLVITAARADRVSFGCSEENDFTYFGRALFAEALQQTDDLQRAFTLAKASVAEREKTDGFEPSEPQIWPAKAVLAQWRKLREQQAERALNTALEVQSAVNP
ncbi:C13 family peptidase [Pseudomonas leptonychotis]|uniref:Peptidase C13 n=1 Tax=Pseudomonas leptonychotis TaxID=2448482 RepID=A0A4T1ZXM9_9PSED|nr:C13 family peptidase [Pseudomonas leptonychotis]TIH07656.1 peptidase C13 [Pseudomonas leptonychotis]